jgi:hypothetical protein
MNANINNTILEVLKPYNPIEVALFGSYARGTQNSESDIDIAVDFPRGITLFDICEILNDFKEKYNLNIDLVEMRAMTENFKESIAKDLKYIYRSVK